MQKRLNRLLCFAFALCLLQMSPEKMFAQTVQRIDASQPLCKGCTLQLTRIATIGSLGDPELPAVGQRLGGLAFDSKGQFFLSSIMLDQVLAYSPTGKFIRSIGRKGNGPGEFHQAVAIAVDANDTLYVLDIGRVTVYSPALKYVRTIAMPAAMSLGIVVTLNNTVLVNQGISYHGAPLKVLSMTGTLSPFTSDSAAIAQCPACTLVAGRGSSRDRVWSTSNANYILKDWNSSGTMQRSFVIAGSTWHRATVIDPLATPNLPPPPVIVAIAEDSQRQVWSLGEMPTTDWKPREPSRPGQPRGRVAVPLGRSTSGPETLKRVVSVVDVFNVVDNRLVLSQQFPHRLFRMIAAGYLAEVREVDDTPVWDIFKVSIKQQ